MRVQSMGRATSWMPCAFKILSIVLVRLIRPLTLVEDQPRLSRHCHPSRQESASEVAHSIKINKSIATENQYCPCNALETYRNAHYIVHTGISRSSSRISFLRDMNFTFRHSNCQILLLDLETSVDLTLFT